METTTDVEPVRDYDYSRMTEIMKGLDIGHHAITIDKCQGCRHWYENLVEREEYCRLCRNMPFRTDNHPYNYREEEVHTTTTASYKE